MIRHVMAEDRPFWLRLDRHLPEEGFARKVRGHRLVMASTRADERAQGFYRRLGYRDAGCLLLREAGYAQPAELFFTKTLAKKEK